MSLVRCAIGLGGNLGDPPGTLTDAMHALASLPGISIVAASSLYRSAAIGPAGQPDYANAVISLDTHLSPWQLLDSLQTLEQDAGRVRDVRWGARTLDLDLLLYGDQCINDDRLTVPHREMHQRAFVLQPLLEVWPDAFDIVTLLQQPEIAGQTLVLWPESRWQAACETHCRHLWSTS